MWKNGVRISTWAQPAWAVRRPSGLYKRALPNQSPQDPTTPLIYVTCLRAPACGNPSQSSWIKEVTMTPCILRRLLFSLFTCLSFGYPFRGQIRKCLYIHFQKFHNPLSVYSVTEIEQLTQKTEQSTLTIKISYENKNTLGPSSQIRQLY